MAEYIYKIAERGTGKTSWLVDQIYNERETKCFILSNNPVQYANICEHYMIKYGSICPAAKVEHVAQIREHDSCVFIDDLLKCDMSTEGIRLLGEHCSRIYITLNGICVQ